MAIVVSLIAMVVALKLAEATGGLQFDNWGGAFGAALVCWFGEWGTDSLIALALPNLEGLAPTTYAVWLFFVLQLVSTLLLLLVAWAVVPGVHVRKFVGLIAAAVLIVGFRLAAGQLLGSISLGL